MDDLHQALLHTVVDARLAEAEDRRRARDDALGRRRARRARRVNARSWRPLGPWPWRRSAPSALRPAAGLHPAAPPTPAAVELGRLLEDLAERALRDGTRSERAAIAAVTAATRAVAPGAAAAAVSLRSPEIARLRALAVLHGTALHRLPAWQQAALVDRLHGGSAPSEALAA